MTVLFNEILRHRCPNDVQALAPPVYDKFPPFERLDEHREQVRAALWQFGGIITAAARYLRVDPARLRRYVYEIDPTLLQDIERIDAALTEYAKNVLAGRGAGSHSQPQRDLHRPSNQAVLNPAFASVRRVRRV